MPRPPRGTPMPMDPGSRKKKATKPSKPPVPRPVGNSGATTKPARPVLPKPGELKKGRPVPRPGKGGRAVPYGG